MHEVSQLGTHQGFVSDVVLTLHVFVPERAASVSETQHLEAQRASCGERDRPGRLGAWRTVQGQRKVLQAIVLSPRQGPAPLVSIDAAVEIALVQRLANRPRERHPGEARTPPPTQPADALWAGLRNGPTAEPRHPRTHSAAPAVSPAAPRQPRLGNRHGCLAPDHRTLVRQPFQPASVRDARSVLNRERPCPKTSIAVPIVDT